MNHLIGMNCEDQSGHREEGAILIRTTVEPLAKGRSVAQAHRQHLAMPSCNFDLRPTRIDRLIELLHFLVADGKSLEKLRSEVGSPAGWVDLMWE